MGLHATIICSLLLSLCALYHCKIIFAEHLIELEDLKKLDEKISSFLKNPNNEGWENNLIDVEFFGGSMKQMIKTMNATFEGLTKTYFRKVEKFVNSGKPLFIDTCVVEEEVQPLIKVTDDQLTRLYWQRLYCEQDWEMLVDMLKVKKQVEIILPE